MDIYKDCLVCGKEFLFSILVPHRLYCSSQCRDHAKYLRNKRNILKRNKQYYRDNRDIVLKKQAIYLKNRIISDSSFKRKYNLRHTTNHLFSLNGLSCQLCGKINNLQRHHLSYRHALSIVILCRNCHNAVHA